MAKFEIGKNYMMNSPCDRGCYWIYKVIARTAKTLTLEDAEGKRRCKVYERDGKEYALPLGRYSMAPVLRPENVTTLDTYWQYYG